MLPRALNADDGPAGVATRPQLRDLDERILQDRRRTGPGSPPADEGLPVTVDYCGLVSVRAHLQTLTCLEFGVQQRGCLMHEPRLPAAHQSMELS